MLIVLGRNCISPCLPYLSERPFLSFHTVPALWSSGTPGETWLQYLHFMCQYIALITRDSWACVWTWGGCIFKSMHKNETWTQNHSMCQIHKMLSITIFSHSCSRCPKFRGIELSNLQGVQNRCEVPKFLPHFPKHWPLMFNWLTASSSIPLWSQVSNVIN